MYTMRVPMLLPPLLLLLQVIIPVTSRLLSVQVMSYKRLRNAKNGPVLCALDTANKTMSSSSLEDCSLSCMRDGTCTGFNIKNLTTCDLYNYKPMVSVLVADCMFYQVSKSTCYMLASTAVCNITSNLCLFL